MNIVKQIALGKIYLERDYIKNIWYYIGIIKVVTKN